MQCEGKKLLFTANVGWYLWNFRKDLMNALRSDGYDITAICGQDEYTTRLANEFPVRITRHLDRGGTNPLRDVFLCIEYIRLYKKLKPDIVFNMTIKPNIYSSFACRILGIPTVSTITGLGYAFTKNNWLQKLVVIMYRYALKKNRNVMFQNSDDQQLFLEKNIVQQQQAVLVPGSGVNTLRFAEAPLPGEGQDVSFLLMARMLRDKGVYQFAEAAKILQKQFHHLRFTLAGPIDPHNPASISLQTITDWQKEGIIHYAGSVDDVVPVVAAHDVVVLPSWYREGIPKSLLEAMSMARPIITTDVPGCRSVIRDGVNGFLVTKPGDTQELISAMEKIIYMSLIERQEMGKAGRMMVEEKFDQEIVFASHRKILDDILVR